MAWWEQGLGAENRKETLKRRAEAETLLTELTAPGKPLCAQKGVCVLRKYPRPLWEALGSAFQGPSLRCKPIWLLKSTGGREVMCGGLGESGFPPAPPSPHLPPRNVSHHHILGLCIPPSYFLIPSLMKSCRPSLPLQQKILYSINVFHFNVNTIISVLD